MDSYMSDQLKHLYLTGISPTGKAIGVGAYGVVFEVQFCGKIYAAKQIHSVLIEGMGPEESSKCLSKNVFSGPTRDPRVQYSL